MSSAPLGLFAYPWDVIDEGVDAVLAAVQRAGLNTLYLATWYHSGMFFLPHNPRRRTYFPQPGALYFTPGEWHAAHPLPPPVSDLTDDWPRFWRDIKTRADAAGVSLAAWMPVLHNSGIGATHRRVAVENPWGDRITHTICPANADVRDLVLNVVRDVARSGIFDRILLESVEYLGLRHGHHHEVIGVHLDPDTDLLASLCFCPACLSRLEAEKVDGERVRKSVRDIVDGALTGAPRQPMGWRELEAVDGGRLGMYLRVRDRIVSSLLVEAAQEIRDASPAIVIAALDFGPLYALGPNGRRWQNGNDLDIILPAIDEIHPTYYFTDPAILAERIETYERVVAGAVPQIPAIRAIMPQTSDSAALAAQLAPVAAIASGYTFYNYSFMPLASLDWIASGLAAHPPARAGAQA
ncbi:MAG: hypothetical protein IT509_11295 [Rhodocyclaceae bacterium]|nr:hypothetical protein [Rhodocyclaceae bacterium]